MWGSADTQLPQELGYHGKDLEGRLEPQQLHAFYLGLGFLRFIPFISCKWDFRRLLLNGLVLELLQIFPGRTTDDPGM